MPDDLKDSILSIFEASLEAQLRAVRRLHVGMEAAPPRRREGLSQVDMAYDILRKTRAPCMSPNCSPAFRPPSASPSIAKASSRPSPRKSPAATASSAPPRTRLHSGPIPYDPAIRVPGHHRRVAGRVSTSAHVAARRSIVPRFSGLLGTALPVPHHLDQRRPAPPLERRIFRAATGSRKPCIDSFIPPSTTVL